MEGDHKLFCALIFNIFNS